MNIKTKERMVTKMSRLWTLAALTVVAATGFTSCLKNSDPQPQQPVTYVAFVNSLGTEYGVDIFMDAKKINSDQFKYGAADGALFTPKNYKIDFKKFGTEVLLASESAPFDTSRYTTLILHGDGSHADVHRILETWSNAATDRANVRFFNLVPNSGPVDLYIGETRVWGGRQYEDFMSGQYDQFTANNLGTFNIVAKGPGGDTLAIKEVSLAARGGFYNIMYQGIDSVTTGDLKPKITLMPYQNQ